MIELQGEQFLRVRPDGTVDGEPLAKLVPAAVARAVEQLVARVLADGKDRSEAFEIAGQRVELRAARLDADQALVVISPRAERSGESEQSLRYERLLSLTRDGVWVVDQEDRTTFVNQRMAEILGWERSEIVGRPLLDFMHDDRKRAVSEHMQRRRAGISEELHSLLRHRSGELVPVRVSSAPILRDDEYMGTIAVITPTGDGPSGEKERLQLWEILDHSLNEIYLFDAQSLKFRYVNAGALRNLGCDRLRIQDLTPLDLLLEHDETRFRELLEPLRSGRVEQLVFEAVHRRIDESEYPIEARLQLAGGDRSLFVAIVTDISERHRNEAALRASEVRFRSLIESGLDLIFLMDESGALSFVSPSVSSLGYEPADLINTGFVDLVHADDQPIAAKLIHSTLGSDSLKRLVLRVITGKGATRFVEFQARNLLHVPEVRGILANARDITEQRELEEQYREAQKLEGLGRLAGGIAHDFNNLLTVILSYAELLESDEKPNPADIREIRRAGERARDLTTQLLAFARRQVISPRAVALNQLVEDAGRMLARLVGENISITMSLTPEPYVVKVDPSQFEQVLLNLALNARDAMPNGGRLSITTELVALDREFARRHPGSQFGRHVLLELSDNGTGIPAAELAHVFEPFYTTKGPGHGTGLGLASVYGIVSQLGGFVRVDSCVGIGTTFKVYLPLTEPAEPTPVESEPTFEHPASSTGILVVEDDDVVRELCVRALSEAGYQVQSASRPEHALLLATESGLQVSLLITDVVMPTMSGKALADALIELIPSLKVLFISGYTHDRLAQQGVLQAGVELLMKPFTPRVLRERVARVLNC